MERYGDEVRLTETEASGGNSPHIIRYMLGISLALAIIILSLVWMSGVIFFSDENPGATAGQGSSKS